MKNSYKTRDVIENKPVDSSDLQKKEIIWKIISVLGVLTIFGFFLYVELTNSWQVIKGVNFWKIVLISIIIGIVHYSIFVIGKQRYLVEIEQVKHISLINNTINKEKTLFDNFNQYVNILSISSYSKYGREEIPSEYEAIDFGRIIELRNNILLESHYYPVIHSDIKDVDIIDGIDDPNNIGYEDDGAYAKRLKESERLISFVEKSFLEFIIKGNAFSDGWLLEANSLKLGIADKIRVHEQAAREADRVITTLPARLFLFFHRHTKKYNDFIDSVNKIESNTKKQLEKTMEQMIKQTQLINKLETEKQDIIYELKSILASSVHQNELMERIIETLNKDEKIDFTKILAEQGIGGVIQQVLIVASPLILKYFGI